MKQLSLLLLTLSAGFAAPPPAVGDKAPAFTLKNLDGVTRSFPETMKQGPVVLVVLRGFPGYQCPLCNRQVMEFVKNGPAFAAAGARVVMVYPGPKENAEVKAQEFVMNKNLPEYFEFLVDPDYSMTNLYNLRWNAPKETAYPSTFIINNQGKITFAKVSNSHGGRTSAAEVLAALGR